jgi:hypothetical protein
VVRLLLLPHLLRLHCRQTLQHPGELSTVAVAVAAVANEHLLKLS